MPESGGTRRLTLRIGARRPTLLLENTERVMASDPTRLENQLLREIQYKIDETFWGIWRRFAYPNGQLFEEFTSHASFFALPWLHYIRRP